MISRWVLGGWVKYGYQDQNWMDSESNSPGGGFRMRASSRTSIIESMKCYISELHRQIAEKEVDFNKQMEKKEAQLTTAHREFTAKFKEIKEKHEEVHLVECNTIEKSRIQIPARHWHLQTSGKK